MLKYMFHILLHMNNYMIFSHADLTYKIFFLLNEQTTSYYNLFVSIVIRSKLEYTEIVKTFKLLK